MSVGWSCEAKVWFGVITIGTTRYSYGISSCSAYSINNNLCQSFLPGLCDQIFRFLVETPRSNPVGQNSLMKEPDLLQARKTGIEHLQDHIQLSD